ncbi:ABC-2 type transport system permease protein [Sphingomonas laterariae]|uniref:ABC-2 type transport system permease protein n=1 Tax=Edaphosphingomonas laterariae TaxID=861865 RepID=A0A239HHE5_9SPHN|nr:ABC transporter permease [Sphingomonas laterariae]SNS80787.1 ABC-2 type transport system permease protein [Sphingomonas laterariae]
MIDVIRAAWVIARRDYVASVFSKTFLLFLLGPLLPILAALMFGAVGAKTDAEIARPRIAIIADTADGKALIAARTQLAARLGETALPELRIVAPENDGAAQAQALLADRKRALVAVARGGLIAPELIGPQGPVAEHQERLGLIYDTARRTRALAHAGGEAVPAVAFSVRTVDKAAGSETANRALTARMGQLVLMMLVMILAGMLLSNLIEEKSNKVIEVLAAAVPVDAIFLGKLGAMLAMSLTGIFVWGATAMLALAWFFPAGGPALPAPALGWPAFVALGTVYFIACYLLLGALFLGIGGQAASVREVQTLSMPVTMGQLGVVALASSAVGATLTPLAVVAMIFPWSSPFAMMARAAQSPYIWPHLLAILWQGIWIAIIIRLAARRFRVSVLKSGVVRRGWFGRKRPA